MTFARDLCKVVSNKWASYLKIPESLALAMRVTSSEFCNKFSFLGKLNDGSPYQVLDEL